MAKNKESSKMSQSKRDKKLKRKRDDDIQPAKDTKQPKKQKEAVPKDDGPPLEVWSKSKKKRMRLVRAKQGQEETGGSSSGSNKKDVTKKPVSPENTQASSRPASSSLQESFKARLSGSRFRILNEDLYTSPSGSAYTRFKANPELYEQYHEGFRHQVEQWPVNPVNVMVHDLKNLAWSQEGNGQIVVADFGCGDAELAKQLLKFQIKTKCPFQVKSFDLVAACDLVTACDMARVPLPRSSVDVATFCLSLMGTNLADFIREAHRVLKDTGRVKIAEVRSRFESSGEKGKDDLQEFIDVLDQLGFECLKTSQSNKMFVLLELKKNGKKPNKNFKFSAKPCIYKRR
jgi:ribosomal RNA-processing protein 8